jgi:hypothetical protein
MPEADISAERGVQAPKAIVLSVAKRVQRPELQDPDLGLRAATPGRPGAGLPQVGVAMTRCRRQSGLEIHSTTFLDQWVP